jgi:electron transfer flavoprotein beta subunit
MHIYACVKEIQDPEIASSVFRVDEDKKQVIPVAGQALVTSPFDEQAIEAALRIRDTIGEARITLVSFGPKLSERAIKRGLAMGADQGILVTDTGLEAADGYATARLLASAIAKANDFNLIITGRQAADWDAGIVGCGIGELLGIPVVTFAKAVRVEGDKVVVERMLDDGVETVEASTPCVVTISNELGEPRKATLRGTMNAAKKPISNLSAADLGLNVEALGISESRQVRERLFVPVKDVQCEFFKGDSALDIASSLAARLFETKTL